MIRKTLAMLAALSILLFSGSAANATQVTTMPTAIPTDYPRVHFVPGSAINLLATSSNIPVRIQNDYAEDVTVHMHAIA
ncbi:MAG: hypothetical protein K9G66_03805, partial [Rhodoluna sp.]|nr:hypothetical protein [Rhodoluna sp.]